MTPPAKPKTILSALAVLIVQAAQLRRRPPSPSNPSPPRRQTAKG